MPTDDPAWLGPPARRLWAQVRPLLPQDEIAHDAAHVLRVTRWCGWLASELEVDPDLAHAAGIVHDLVHIPKDSAARSSASLLSAAAARGPLEASGHAPAACLRIVEAVRTCSWSAALAPTSPLGAVLQDADRLDAIGVVGAFRNIAVAQDMSRRSCNGAFWHPLDPFCEGDRTLDDRRWALDHWKIKLLRLRDGMHTHAAQREATRRTAHMFQLLDMLASEMAVHPHLPR